MFTLVTKLSIVPLSLAASVASVAVALGFSPWSPPLVCLALAAIPVLCVLRLHRRANRFQYKALQGAPDRLATVGPVRRVLVLGGSGQVGQAVAVHLLRTSRRQVGRLEVVLCGRSPARREAAVHSAVASAGGISAVLARGHSITSESCDFKNYPARLSQVLESVHTVIHVAGCSAWDTSVLQASIAASGVRCYVDVSDQVHVLQEATLAYQQDARASDTMAVLSAGAFPGMSNVLAVELASRTGPEPAKNIEFNYFTSGLGGSGVVNLFITNLGFGERVRTVRGGQLDPTDNAGLGRKEVEFYLDSNDRSFSAVGTVSCWAWPFPEVQTVPQHLGISGNSTVRMGTAPHIWNLLTMATARLFPRSWWRSRAFSYAWAVLSEPTVLFTDFFVVDETHCIRVDVDGANSRATAIQAHKSFRVCVGQSIAEFALELMLRERARDDEGVNWRPGVYLPEHLVSRDEVGRKRLLTRLTGTEGTITYRIAMEENATM